MENEVKLNPAGVKKLREGLRRPLSGYFGFPPALSPEQSACSRSVRSGSHAAPDWRAFFALSVPDLLTVVDSALQDRTLYSNALFDKKLRFPTTFDVRSGTLAPADTDSGVTIEEFQVRK